MRRQHCNADTTDETKFCVECGAPLQPRCPCFSLDTRPSLE